MLSVIVFIDIRLSDSVANGDFLQSTHSRGIKECVEYNQTD